MNRDPGRSVTERRAAATRAREESLCCPVDDDPRWLEAIPPETEGLEYDATTTGPGDGCAPDCCEEVPESTNARPRGAR